ncbi:MAG: SH3 domain-containing protein [bacterium]|nr:SH3 domain-containing protein [bacterium]
MLRRLWIVVLLFVLVTVAAAQGAPDQINLALADLSTRLGFPVTLEILDNWNWSQDDYPDTSLGCPQAGQAYNPLITVGYRFELTYGGSIYDYRVAADRSIVLLCSVTPLGETTPEATTPLEEAVSNPLCPVPPAGIVYPVTRLTVEIQGRVVPGLPNNVRAEPNTSAALVGEIPGGGVFTVVAGPQCDATGLVWWQVDFDGLIGWTAEGANGQYFIEPAPGALLPTDRAVIALENAAQLNELSRLQGNFAPALAWVQEAAPDGTTPTPAQLIALGDLGANGAWIYDTAALEQAPRILDTETRLTQIAVGPDAILPLFGANDGTIRLWDIRTTAPLLERAQLQSQADPVTAVAFSADGTTLAAAGGRAILQQDVPENQYAIATWDVETVSLRPVALRGHTNEVMVLAFGIDNTTLYSASLDGTVRTWNVQTGESTVLYDGGVSINDIALSADGAQIALATVGQVVLLNATSGEALATIATPAAANSVSFSPEGTLLAVAGADGLVSVLDAAAMAEGSDQPLITTLSGHDGAVEAVAFSPDGSLIATLGEDNTLRLWGVVESVG